MKTQKQQLLLFNKQSVLELNDQELYHVNGGSTDVIESIIRAATYGSWLDFL